MTDNVYGEDQIISFAPKFRELGVPVHDGGGSYITINFCAWCATKLPSSLCSTWFEALEAIGIDPSERPIPPQYTDERWYLERSL